MIADWQKHGHSLIEWYMKAKDNMQMHPETREWVEGELRV
jgi:hypothetical protein